MSSKTFKFLNARQEGAKDTELMARSGSDKLDLTLAQMDLRGPLSAHGDFDVKDSQGASKFSVVQASGNVAAQGTLDVAGKATLSDELAVTLATALSSTLDVSGMSTLAEAKVSDLTQHRITMAGADGRLRDESGLTYQAASGLAITGTLDASGDFKINTDKFEVTAATGAANLKGNLTSDSAWSLSATGDMALSGTADINGRLKVGADDQFIVNGSGDLSIKTASTDADAKFSVDAATGNVASAGTADVAGDFKINTAKFVVTAASGNTDIAGRLDVADAAVFDSSLSAGLAKFVVAADGTKVSINSGGLSPVDMFEVSDAGALKAHSIADMDGSSLWSIDTAGDAIVQQLNAKGAAHLESTLRVDGILSQKEELQIEASKKLRFWDSTAAGSENKGFVGYDSANSAIVIDAAPDGAGGKVVIEGDLQVTGTTTTIDSTEVEIADKLFRVSKGSQDLQTADGSGIEVGNDLASFKYDHNGGADSHWDLTHGLTVAAKINSADVEAVGEVKGATLDITTSAVLASAKVSDLVDGRVVLAGTAGELEDSANLTFNGTKLTVTGDASVSSDFDASAGKFSTDASSSLVKIKDYGLNIIDDSGQTPVVKASITAAGAMELEDTASIKGDLSINDTKFVVTASTGAVNLKGDLTSDAAWSITSLGAMALDSTASIKGDLSINTDKFTVAAGSGDVNLKGDLTSDSAWSITSLGAITAASGELSGDLKASGEKFHVNTAGTKINISGYSLHIDDADPSTPSDVFKVSKSGDLDADGVAQLFKYVDGTTGADQYAFKVYDQNSSGMGSAMPVIQSQVELNVLGDIQAMAGMNISGDMAHLGSNASFASGIFQIQAASGSSNPVPPGGSAGGSSSSGGGATVPGSLKSSVNVLPMVGSSNSMPDLGSSSDKWLNVYATNLHAEAMNLDSLLLSGTAPAAPVEGQLWYDSTVGKLKFYDDEREHVVGESDITELSEREISMNHYAETGDDDQDAELRIYRHESGSERATFVAIRSAGTTQEGGSEMHLQAAMLLHDQAEGDKPSSSRNIQISKNVLADVQMFDILVIDGANDGFKKFDAETDTCPFGQSPMSVAANTAYDGHIEMKDRELGWVILSGAAQTTPPSFGDSLYYGAGAHAGKAVDFATADGHVDAQGQPAGFVIEIGHVLKVADMQDNAGNTYKCAYIQFCFDKKYQN